MIIQYEIELYTIVMIWIIINFLYIYYSFF